MATQPIVISAEASTAGPPPTTRGRQLKVWDGMGLGYTARQLAGYLQVSETTIRRDMRRLGPHPTAGMPDAYRERPAGGRAAP